MGFAEAVELILEPVKGIARKADARARAKEGISSGY